MKRYIIAVVALIGSLWMSNAASAQYPPRFVAPQVGYAGVAAVQCLRPQTLQVNPMTLKVPTLQPTTIPSAPVARPVAVASPVRAQIRK